MEPFTGGGALFFHVAQTYAVEDHVLADANPELVLAYRTVQQAVEPLIACLREMETAYLPLAPAERKCFYYDTRDQFNETRLTTTYDRFQPEWIRRTAQLIFLNRTCYNGLFRVNSRGEFNVPFGRYKRPLICAADNLRAVSALLQQVELRLGAYDTLASRIDGNTFVYFDPPYRPISKTASFTGYSQQVFDDAAQLELADFYHQLHQKGALLMLSNSDPKNVDQSDTFFDDAYAAFRIERILARRAINSKGSGRGLINELLILNYAA